MGEFEDKINQLLGSPESMSQIMDLARSFTKEGDSSGDERPSGKETGQNAPDLSSLLKGFTSEGIDPKMLQTLGRLAGEFASPDANRHTALISALKPYLREERHEKIDKALQIAKMAKIAKVAFKDFGGGDKLV